MSPPVIPFERARSGRQTSGRVALVGAGPGDPELLTLKALRLLQQADAVVYDRLVNPLLLEHCSARCEKIYVGKRKDQHSLPQVQICQLLVELAERGLQVVRLKGGDPFVFGRGGEEYDALSARAIRCEIVPGITAAIGCAAAAHIPLTHRDHAHALTFITGHRREHIAEHSRESRLDINWELALQPDHTVVFYMGLSNLAEICQQLLLRGADPERPFAVVANGTGCAQQIVVGTLATIAAEVARYQLPSPALLIMGDVVRANDYALNQFVAMTAEHQRWQQQGA